MVSNLVQRSPVRGRVAAVAVVILAAAGLGACSNGLPPATVPASGVTSSNGGGMRTTGALPDVGVSTNGGATGGTMSRNPRIPTY